PADATPSGRTTTTAKRATGAGQGRSPSPLLAFGCRRIVPASKARTPQAEARMPPIQRPVPDRDGPHDECGVFGVYAPGHDVARLAYFGLYALQHRGQ